MHGRVHARVREVAVRRRRGAVRASPWESLAARRPIQFTYRLVLREDVSMKLTAFGSVVGSKDAGSHGSVHETPRQP